ncbi:hypothetical protein BYT27DRAFT_7118543, partial [Phlegmacium glaucopus]
HANVVAKAALQKRRVRLIKAPGMTGEGMQMLSEKQLLMDNIEGDKPMGAQFVGANKSGGQGVGEVVYKLNSEEAAEWIKTNGTMKAFISKRGSMVDYKALTFKVVFDWVPTSFNTEQRDAWKAVESARGIWVEGIQEVRWIKPMHLRVPGQRSAIAIIGFAMREDANMAINTGLFIEGKKVWGRKQIQEPKRCLKCQCFGIHKAAKCTSIHETWGRCAKHHKTSECTEDGRKPT